MTTNDIQNYIEKLLKYLGFFENSIDFDISDHGTKIFKVKTNHSKELIGKDGETLKALNYLIKRFVEKNGEEGHYLLDVNDYQNKKIERIKTIAYMMAERARFFKDSIELDPMNSFERHIIHDYIQTCEDLETESTGFGKNRKVIIKYKR